MADAWVYMLAAATARSTPAGATTCSAASRSHRAGRASRYTASRLPVELVLARAMADRSAAMREEARIKRLDRAAKLALIAADAACRSAAPRRRRARRVAARWHDGRHGRRIVEQAHRRAASRSPTTSARGWSSDRPRRDGAPARPADLTVHCRVLAPGRPPALLARQPAGRLCASAAERDAFSSA